MKKIIDISAAIPGCRVYPGDPAPKLVKVRTVDCDGCNLTEISVCAHNGTHVDAPCHFIRGGGGAESIELSSCMGRCVVTDSAEDAIRAARNGEERIILKGCDVTAEEAEELASRIRLLGTDGLSFGEACGKQAAVHTALLGKGVVLLEGLELGEVKCGTYELIALPLRLTGSDGSPVRAVLIDD